jgi:ferredoxin
MSEAISREGLLRLVDEWLEAGHRVVGPVADAPTRPGQARFAVLKSSADLLLDGFIHPVNTAKEHVLPKTEKLYGYEREGQRVRLVEPRHEPPRTLLIGCRPCDAAAFPIVDAVMDGDYRDSQYLGRRAALTVVTLGCSEWDDQCFCTSVGLGPTADRGSDAVLVALPDGSYDVRTVTDAGRRLFDGRTSTGEETGTVVEEPTGPELLVNLEHVRTVLKGDFHDPLWQELGLRCLGCGSCTYTCPTCHCFDIVDESHGSAGCRIRNWDSCQFALFTAHASGHNPRSDQAARQRQRIMHKFVVYPEKFGDYLCTGCGNCFRNCPVNLGVLDVLRTADARSEVVGEAK